MRRAQLAFNESLRGIREQGNLHEYLTTHMPGPFPFDDILRFQFVFAVSAFDKLMHDIIQVGIMAIFAGQRSPTPKFNNEAITIELHKNLINASIPPAEVLFEQEIIRKLKVNSYQHPDKVADGLSFIWDQKNKWHYISAEMGWLQEDVVTKLKLVSTRRNAIVHEADVDPVVNSKKSINRQECNEVIDFIDVCGNSIVNLVA